MNGYNSGKTRNNDPFPYVSGSGSRHAYPGVLNGVALTHAPRVGFNYVPYGGNSNPILRDLRDFAPVEYGMWLGTLEGRRAGLFLAGVPSGYSTVTPEHVTHAVKVLTRLVRMQNPVLESA